MLRIRLIVGTSFCVVEIEDKNFTRTIFKLLYIVSHIDKRKKEVRY